MSRVPLREARAEPARDPGGRPLPAAAPRPRSRLRRRARGRGARARSGGEGAVAAGQRHPAPDPAAPGARAAAGERRRQARRRTGSRDSSRIRSSWSSAGSSASARRRRGGFSSSTTAPSRLDLLTNPARRGHARRAARAARGGAEVETEPSAGVAAGADRVGVGQPAPLAAARRGPLQRPGRRLAAAAAAPAPRRAARRSRGRARRQVAVRAGARAHAGERPPSTARSRGCACSPRTRAASDIAEALPVAGDFAALPLPEGRFEPRAARRAVQRDGNAAQEPRDPLPRDGGGDRAPRRARRRRRSSPRCGCSRPAGTCSTRRAASRWRRTSASSSACWSARAESRRLRPIDSPGARAADARRRRPPLPRRDDGRLHGAPACGAGMSREPTRRRGGRRREEW